MREKCLMSLALVLACACAAWAQENTTGSIAGRVIDAQSLPVPGATVTVVTPQGPRALTTDSDGRFFASYLTPGQYEVRVELQGFRTIERQNVDVRLGQRVDLTLSMQVGSITEAVTVSARQEVVEVAADLRGRFESDRDVQRLEVARMLRQEATLDLTRRGELGVDDDLAALEVMQLASGRPEIEPQKRRDAGRPGQQRVRDLNDVREGGCDETERQPLEEIGRDVGRDRKRDRFPGRFDAAPVSGARCQSRHDASPPHGPQPSASSRCALNTSVGGARSARSTTASRTHPPGNQSRSRSRSSAC